MILHLNCFDFISEGFKVYPESVSFTFSSEFVADFGVEFPH